MSPSLPPYRPPPVRQLHGGRKYYFKVLAYSPGGSAASDEVMYEVPEHVQKKAITAALVGGLLLLIVSIILSICTVKICNKRKRRQQEKGQQRQISSVQDVSVEKIALVL